MQIIAASAITALLLGWMVTMLSAVYSQYASNRDSTDLLNREAKVASAESRVSAYRKDIEGVASELEKRQEVLEQLSEAYFGELPSDPEPGETVSDSSRESARAIDKISATLPEASSLARTEARQLAFVERLTRYADRRSTQAAEIIRKLGLNPSAMIASASNRDAQGGPLIRMTTSKSGSLDPRFRRLGASLARMDALERGLSGIPQVLPASLKFISSGFGYRSDPFNGTGAFHAGLDFRGPAGAPIYAAAKGKISFAGFRRGYGNVVDIDHGNGLMTRYAHMSAFRARVGQAVEAGDIIGAIGSTGRSTGPHLHFEVRVHDRPVNPRPFLEAAPHVPEETPSRQAANGE